MTTLSIALERQQWELAALCLLWGVSRTAMALPPDAVDGLLAVLDAGAERRPPPRPQKRGGHSDRRR